MGLNSNTCIYGVKGLKIQREYQNKNETHVLVLTVQTESGRVMFSLFTDGKHTIEEGRIPLDVHEEIRRY